MLNGIATGAGIGVIRGLSTGTFSLAIWSVVHAKRWKVVPLLGSIGPLVPS